MTLSLGFMKFFHFPDSITLQNVTFFRPQNARMHFEKFSESNRFLLEFLDKIMW